LVIDIELFGQLLPGKPRKQTIEIPKPETARDLAMTLGLNPDDIGLVTINGVQSDLKDLVHSGSRLCFFPYITGG
jgi:hypothetical protein